DLRKASRRRRNAYELELCEAAIAGCNFALALKHVDFDHLLVIGDGGKHEALLCRNGRVAVEDLCEQTSAGLDAERQRDDVEKNRVFDVAGEASRLNRRADRHDLIGVDLYRRLAMKDLSHALNDDGRASLTADEQHLCDVGRSKLYVGERLLA